MENFRGSLVYNKRTHDQLNPRSTKLTQNILQKEFLKNHIPKKFYEN